MTDLGVNEPTQVTIAHPHGSLVHTHGGIIGAGVHWHPDIADARGPERMATSERAEKERQWALAEAAKLTPPRVSHRHHDEHEVMRAFYHGYAWGVRDGVRLSKFKEGEG